MQSTTQLGFSQLSSTVVLARTELAKALFFSIKQQDFVHAERLLLQGAPASGIFELEKDVYLSTSSLLVKAICAARISQGHKAKSYNTVDALLDKFIESGVDLRCHCSSKFEHRCPLYIAIKTLKIANEEELFKQKNVLVQKLIVKGATIQEHSKPHRTISAIPSFNFESIRSYLISREAAAETATECLQTATSHFLKNRQTPLSAQHRNEFSTKTPQNYNFSFKYQ